MVWHDMTLSDVEKTRWNLSSFEAKHEGSLVLDALNFSTPADVLTKLLKLGANPSQGTDAKGRAPLLLAVDQRNQFAISSLLAHKANATVLDAAGRSALSAAMTMAAWKTAEALLKAGADPQKGRDKDGQKPLLTATIAGSNTDVPNNSLKTGYCKHSAVCALQLKPESSSVQTIRHQKVLSFFSHPMYWFLVFCHSVIIRHVGFSQRPKMFRQATQPWCGTCWRPKLRPRQEKTSWVGRHWVWRSWRIGKTLVGKIWKIPVVKFLNAVKSQTWDTWLPRLPAASKPV